jgi:Fe2+ or Zn2+ uptake regulation protein
VVTVYRTLATLQEMGEVLEVQSADPVAHYDGYRPDRHSHLVCVSCGRVTDSPPMDIQDVIAALGRESAGWQINQEAQFHGICPECQQKSLRGDEGGA